MSRRRPTDWAFGASPAARQARVYAEGLTCRYVAHVVPLAFLAPDIVASILAGTQPVDLTAQKLIKEIDLPLDWAEQRALLGFE